MEGRGREENAEISSANLTKQAGPLMLKNFIIPRKKRVSGQVLLEPCPEESWDYSLIQSKLKESRLDMRKENANAWQWKDVKLVHNEEFLKEFSEKRSEMRSKGRHGREMEEQFCFLVASHEATTQMYQLGLRTGNQDQYSLGKPSCGVYLFRHVDVALKHAATSTNSGTNLIIFKVLYGRVKKVTPSTEWNKTPDPTVAFDCHMSKDSASYRDSLSQQELGSSVFLFDYNENQELNKRPRQCLPYAVIQFVPAACAISPVSISSPALTSKHSTSALHGPLENLKGCTVAKRSGKGETATVTFKHFATQDCPDLSRSQTSGLDLNSFQQNELQNPSPFIPQQLYMPLFHTAGYYSPSVLPYFDNSTPSQNCLGETWFSSNVQHTSTAGIYGSNTEACGAIAQHPGERIATIVYSSRTVKDPRLTRQETNIQEKTSEQENASNVSANDGQKQQPHTTYQEKKDEFNRTVSREKQEVQGDKEHRKDCDPKPSEGVPHEPQPKAENMPSIKLFKMKFQKYAAYFKMTEEERQKHIWSKENLTLEQKKSLINRIHFYELHYQKYKQGMLFPKVNETENGLGSSHIGTKNNKQCQSTVGNCALQTQGNPYEVNEAKTDHSLISDVSKSSSLTNLANTKTNMEDTLCTDSIKHNSSESTTNCLKDTEHDRRPHCLEHCVESQSVLSEESLEQEPSLENLSEKSKDIENTCDSEQPLCPDSPSKHNRINHKSSAINNSTIESFVNECTLSNNLEKRAGYDFHDITAMDASNIVEISLLDESQSKDLSSATSRWQDENSPVSTESHNEEFLIHVDDKSEMSVEFRRVESPQDNTIYNALYKRLQLDQVLPNLNGLNISPQKPDLMSKDLDKTLSISQKVYCLDKTAQKEDNNKVDVQKGVCGKDLLLTVRMKSIQLPAIERPTLSERFSKLRSLHKKLKIFLQKKQVINSFAVNSTGGEKLGAEVLIANSHGGKGPENDNAKLIRLLAQRYNEERSCVNWRCFQGKRSKVLNRQKSKFSGQNSKHSSQSLTSVLRRPLQIKKRYMCKTKKKYSTTQDSNLYPQCQALVSKMTSNLCTTGSVSESTPNPAKQPLEIDDVSIILSSGNVQERQADKATKDPTITNDMELESTTSISHQEIISSIIFPRNSESNNDNKIVNAEHKQDTVSVQNLSPASVEQVRENKIDSREISTDSTGAYEDDSDPVQAVSSILSDITSGNAISSCTAKAQTDTTSDLPGAMNNDESATEKRMEILYDRHLVDARSGVIKQVTSTMGNDSGDVKEAMEVNVDIQKTCWPNETKSTDAKDKVLLPREDADQSNKKIMKGDKDDIPKIPMMDLIFRHEGVKTSPDEVLSAQLRPDVRHSGSNRIIDSDLRTTADKVSVSVKERDIDEIKKNLRSVWQREVKDAVTTTSETQLISKLRDYLTKFEFTVKRQDLVSDSGKDGQVPMAWITLDSTIHKRQLLASRQNILNFADHQHQANDSTKKDGILNYTVPSILNEQVAGKTSVQTADSQVVNTKRQTGKSQPQSKSCTSKRTGSCKVESVSPDSTSVLNTVKKDSYPNDSHLPTNKDAIPVHISTSVPSMQLWMPNENLVQQNQINCVQGSGKLNGLHGERSHPNLSISGKAQQALYEEKVNTYVQRVYSAGDISSILKLADHALSLGELISLQFKCKTMLQYFISNFEQDQRVSFNQSCVSRTLILEKYLEQPPVQVDMKFEALNSFLELQMMMEAWQFVENKINFLKRKPTFRSLLWYDPTLYGELYKGAVGFQQQSSLFSSFQQCLASEGYSKLHEYYIAVSTLHQQLQDSPDTSYYMYLKSKRERLEVEAALRNPPDVKSFFLSVPIAVTVNFGDSLESLEKAHRLVMTFVETPSDRLPGMFDVGKAEHLSIICRYLQEKANFLKSSEDIGKVSWFGLEHLLYDASKILVWSESEYGMSNEVLMKYKRLNPQIVYGVTEEGIALYNNREQPPHPMERVITPQKKKETAKKRRNGQSELSVEMEHSTLKNSHEDGVKITHQSGKRRATHPPLRINNGGLPPLFQSNQTIQLGNPPSYTVFPQQSNAEPWRMPRNSSWDWNQQGGVQPSTSNSEIRALLLSKRRATIPCSEPKQMSVTDIQNSHAVSQRDWPPPLMMNPRAPERINHQPMIGVPHQAALPKQQANDSTMSTVPSFPFLTFPQDATSVVPHIPPLPFSDTSDQVLAHNKPTPINYPYFVFNDQMYSTAGSSVTMSTVHNETQYHPHPV